MRAWPLLPMMPLAMLPSPRAAASIGLVLTIACGPTTPESVDLPRRIEDPTELDELDEAAREKQKKQTQKWKRAEPPPMPETFIAFESPDLAALDGAWLVESEVPGQQVLWLIEEGGAKLTEVDYRGREHVYSLSIASPCALRLIDEEGQTRSRSLALRGELLLITRKGATAVRGRDGSMLACVGHRTYQIAADGRCRYTTEMLGNWTEPAAPDERCELGKDAEGPLLTIAAHRLREREGVWIDDGSTSAEAVRVADREAGLAAIQPTPPASPPAAEPPAPEAPVAEPPSPQ